MPLLLVAGLQKRGAGAAWSSGAVPVEGRRPSAAAGLLLRDDTPRGAAGGPGRVVAGTDAAWPWDGLVCSFVLYANDYWSFRVVFFLWFVDLQKEKMLILQDRWTYLRSFAR